MQAIIHAADIQDRDGGVLLMGSLFGLFPFLLKLYADSGYQGERFQRGLGEACRQVNVAIIRRSEVRKFVVLPKRWIVERTIGWLNRCRRMAKGLGMSEPKRPCFPALGLNPADGQKAMPKHNMISDGL
jgi:transposase